MNPDMARACTELVAAMAKEPCQFARALKGKTCADQDVIRGCWPCRARRALAGSAPRDLNFGRPADPARVEP